MRANAGRESPRLRSGQALRSVRTPGSRSSGLRTTEQSNALRVRLLDDGRIGVGGFFFVGVDFAVVFGVERAMLGVEVAGRHHEDEAVLLALETGGVVAAMGVDHA